MWWSNLFENMSPQSFVNFSFLPKYTVFFTQGVVYTLLLAIVSVALGVGYGMGANSGILANTPHAFQLICGESGIVPAAFVAILLNVLLPKNDQAE